MKGKRGLLRRTMALVLTAITIMQSTVQYASADYSGQLGTNKALGSPILNNNFVADDWNKWEMVVWGIFLSNFAHPLIDDYNSAFNSNAASGSHGSGYKALQFGSGSDPANAKVLQSLLDAAINQQKIGQIKQVYVKHTDVNGTDGIENQGGASNPIAEQEYDADGNPIASTNSNAGIIDGDFRPATLKDFIFASKKGAGDTYVKIGDTHGKFNFKTATFKTKIEYKTFFTFEEGSLPTFAVESSGNYETVFDYTNSWDVQLLNAWFGRMLAGDLADEFAKEINEMWKEADQLPVYFDCFGNIVVKYKDSNRILIPAAANQHLTDTKKINLINSMIFNGYMGAVSGDNLILRGQQQTWTAFGMFKGGGTTGGSPDNSGVPAFGSRISGIKPGTATIYYDLDTVVNRERMDNSGDVHLGNSLLRLFNTDINDIMTDVPLKIEISNLMDTKVNKLDGEVQTAIETTAVASAMVTNAVKNNPPAQILNTVKTNNSDISILNDPVIVPVQADVGADKNKINNAGAARMYMNFIYQVYTGKIKDTTAAKLDGKLVTNALTSSKTVSDLALNLCKPSGSNISSLLAGFISNTNNLFTIKTPSPSNILQAKSNMNVAKTFAGLDGLKYSSKEAVDLKYSIDKEELGAYQRVVKAYPVSDTMINISNTLGARDGTDFAQWSSFIYMTYLDWYGITYTKKLGQPMTATSNLNMRLFDDKSDIANIDIQNIADVKTEEDKKKDVLNYTYLMLHPTEGREYRTDLITSGMSDWVYKNYNNIVYGNASSYYSGNNSNLATRNATGFLNIDSYSDNVFTAWLMKDYGNIAVTIMIVAALLIVIIGLLKSKKLSWFIITLVVAVNSILIIPTTGEIVPYIGNKYVQSMFNGKMTYWSMLEAISNANMESDMVKSVNNGNLTETEAAQVADMVKHLNVTYLDRALMLKTDISRKITETASGNYEALQSLKSARWMLPMLMRQFSANDGSADYVYIPLGDMLDDVSNMYWFYNPDDAATANTVNSDQEVNVNYDKSGLLSNIRGSFPDYQYTDDYFNEDWSSPSYYTIDDDGEIQPKDKTDITHSFFYLLEGQYSMLSRSRGFGELSGKKAYEEYVKNSLVELNPSQFVGMSAELEKIAGEYIRSDRKTVEQKYGYLWTTENPGHYFYQNVKDMFPSSNTLGHIVGGLQGTYVINDENIEVRKSFMHSKETGHTRDIADLEGLFRNVIPYLYQIMLTTGGTDGTSGLLGDAKINGYSIYKENDASWMYRSNWAVKILENSNYIKADTVKDADGNNYRVANPALPDNYPDNRPMIFSEAQRVSMGIPESGLTLVELKCININKNTEREWTTLLNYANTNGITKEVILRQMAVNSLIEFNKEFSPTGLLSGNKAMYPNSIDLRAISFDSVMKMLIINVTKDVTYIHGDTMKSVVEDTDIFTAVLLLLVAFLCCYIIPLLRNVALAFIFYLGLLSIIRAVITNEGSKSKVSLGYMISNVLFLIITLIYYGVFSGLMRMTTHDELITTQSVQVSVGNPVWLYIILLIVSAAYLYGIFVMINTCFKNFRDMGFEVYSELAGAATGKIADTLNSLGGKLTEWGSNGSSSYSNSGGVSGTGEVAGATVDVNVNQGDVDATIINDITTNQRNYTNIENEASAYRYSDAVDIDEQTTMDIEAEIEKGKSME